MLTELPTNRNLTDPRLTSSPPSFRDAAKARHWSVALADLEREDVHRWQQLFDTDPGAVPHQHPEVVLQSLSLPCHESAVPMRGPFLVARRDERELAPKIAC